MMEDPYKLKRKVIPGHVDCHPSENALIVNYFVQINENGQFSNEKTSMQKIVRVPILKDDTNLFSLAQEVIDKCKLIHPNKIKDVEQQLYFLQQRQMEGANHKSRKKLNEIRASTTQDSQMAETPSLDKIESYIEGLYEEMSDKINSTRNILQLARTPENMNTLVENESLMSALARVIREDGKKSMELVTNIIYIFFCFSNFSHLHPFVISNKIGDTCLRITDQEIQRYNIWIQDLDKLESKNAQHKDSQTTRELEQEHRKFQAMLKKQDQLLFVSFHLLLNLSEDLSIEVKMVKRDIVKYLILMMDRRTPELLILVVSFLKKLTIFKQNKDELIKNSDLFLSKLDKVLDHSNMGLQNLTLRLLLNLSHDEGFRAALINKNGLLNKIMSLLDAGNKHHHLFIFQILYMLSVDDKSKVYFGDCCPMVIKSILEVKSETPEILALAINLSLNPKNAAVMCADNGLKFLMKKALKTRSVLLFKLLRNIASHDGDLKMLFLDFIDDLMLLLSKCIQEPQILVELLGILGNLSIPHFDYAKLSLTYNLHSFIASRLANASSSSLTEDDDLTLELIVLAGTMSVDDGFAKLIANTDIIGSLIGLMMGKEEDDEIILQICYCIYNLLLHAGSREVLISNTQIVSYLIDLLYDRNVEIRKMCDACLDIIAEIDEEWVNKIKVQKFQWHNAEWLSCISQKDSYATSDDDSSRG